MYNNRYNNILKKNTIKNIDKYNRKIKNNNIICL